MKVSVAAKGGTALGFGRFQAGAEGFEGVDDPLDTAMDVDFGKKLLFQAGAVEQVEGD
jgi:hypothetical protein